MKMTIKLTSVLSILLLLSACGGVFNKQAKYMERQQTYGNMALYYLAHNRINEAQEYLLKAEQEDMHSLKIMHANALLAARKGNTEIARDAFVKAIDMAESANPELRKMILRDYAGFLCANNSVEQGLEILAENQAQEDANNLQAQLVSGQCYAHNEDLKKAQAFYRRSLEITESAPALLALAKLAKDEASYLQARAFLQRYFFLGAMSDEALKLAVMVEGHLKNKEQQAYYESMMANVNLSSVTY